MSFGQELELFALSERAADELLLDLFHIDVAKALDPLRNGDFDRVVAHMASVLKSAAMPAQAAALRRAIDTLDVDWGSLDAAGRDRIVAAARQHIADIPARVLPKVEQGFKVESERIVAGTKKSTILKYKLDIRASLTTLDERVVKFSAESQGNFIRDQFGRRAVLFGERTKAIVSAALEQGYGRREIAEELQSKLADAGRSEGYWSMIASVFACRARSFSQVSSFAEAGIGAFTWESILDEVTSVQCRFLHGQRFPVARALEVFAAIEAAQDPEEIKRLNPFMQHGKDPEGREALFLGRVGEQRKLAARVEENTVGQKDKPGRFSGGMNAEALAKAGVVAPPAHGECRSTIVPDEASLSVPAPVPQPVAPLVAPPPPVAPPTSQPKPPAPRRPKPAPANPLLLPEPPLPPPLEGERQDIISNRMTEALRRADVFGDKSLNQIMKPMPKKGDARPFDKALAGLGKPLQDLLKEHGEDFIVDVPKNVHATVAKVDRARLDAYIRADLRSLRDAVVVKHDGQLYAVAGHEQFVAAKFRNEMHGTNVRVLDLDKLARPAEVSPAQWKGLADKVFSKKEEDQKDLRSALRQQLASMGVVSRDDRRSNPYSAVIRPDSVKATHNQSEVRPDSDRELAGANAFHDWKGRTVTRESVAKNAVEGMKFLGENSREDGLRRLPASMEAKLDGLRTYLHEEAHGCSKAEPQSYAGFGIGIEEASTEILARKAIREMIGYKDPIRPPPGSGGAQASRVPFSLPTKSGSGSAAAYGGGYGSYNNYIHGLFNVVAKHTGDEDIARRIEDAIVATRRWTSGKDTYKTAKDQVVDFVNNLRSGKTQDGVLRDHVKDALVDALTAPNSPLNPPPAKKP